MYAHLCCVVSCSFKFGIGANSGLGDIIILTMYCIIASDGLLDSEVPAVGISALNGEHGTESSLVFDDEDETVQDSIFDSFVATATELAVSNFSCAH